ncbi:MAG: GMP synthase subunit A, partial [Methermicoccaceae archaeon]
MSEIHIVIVSNLGQFNHLIHRALRDIEAVGEASIAPELVGNTLSVDEMAALEPDGIIIGGGPDLGRSGNCAQYLRSMDLPILGICLGHQLMALTYGGKVQRGVYGGYASVELEVLKEDAILRGMPHRMSVWASHMDEVAELPPHFERLARSDVCEIEAMRHASKPLYGVQWHPEVSHTEHGEQMLQNFLGVCEVHK